MNGLETISEFKALVGSGPTGGGVDLDEYHDVAKGYRSCIDQGCDEPAIRVVTLFGGVAPVCDEHAEERLEEPGTVDQTAYFSGEREEPKPEPRIHDLPPEARETYRVPEHERETWGSDL